MREVFAVIVLAIDVEVLTLQAAIKRISETIFDYFAIVIASIYVERVLIY